MLSTKPISKNNCQNNIQFECKNILIKNEEILVRQKRKELQKLINQHKAKHPEDTHKYSIGSSFAQKGTKNSEPEYINLFLVVFSSNSDQ